MLFALSDDPQTNDESEYSADMHIKTKNKKQKKNQYSADMNIKKTADMKKKKRKKGKGEGDSQRQLAGNGNR